MSRMTRSNLVTDTKTLWPPVRSQIADSLRVCRPAKVLFRSHALS